MANLYQQYITLLEVIPIEEPPSVIILSGILDLSLVHKALSDFFIKFISELTSK